MNAVSADGVSSLTNSERRLAARILDNWERVFPALEADPKLMACCRRLLGRYSQDLIRRIESYGETIEESLTEANAADAFIPAPQRRCDVAILSRLFADREAA